MVNHSPAAAVPVIYRTPEQNPEEPKKRHGLSYWEKRKAMELILSTGTKDRVQAIYSERRPQG